MKLVSGRKYKNDISDIVGIISEIKKERDISLSEIEKAVIDLYGDMSKVNYFAYSLLKDCLNNSLVNYEEIKKIENQNKDNLLELDGDIRFLNDDNINYILEKLK